MKRLPNRRLIPGILLLTTTATIYSQTKYYSSLKTGHKFITKSSPETPNPLENSSYSGDKLKYQQHLNDIHKFNQQHQKSLLLKKLYPQNINIQQLFRLNFLNDTIKSHQMSNVIKAESYELIELFFDQIYPTRYHEPDVQFAVNDMLKTAIYKRYEPFIWLYTANQLKIILPAS